MGITPKYHSMMVSSPRSIYPLQYAVSWSRDINAVSSSIRRPPLQYAVELDAYKNIYSMHMDTQHIPQSQLINEHSTPRRTQDAGEENSLHVFNNNGTLASRYLDFAAHNGECNFSRDWVFTHNGGRSFQWWGSIQIEDAAQKTKNYEIEDVVHKNCGVAALMKINYERRGIATS